MKRTSNLLELVNGKVFLSFLFISYMLVAACKKDSSSDPATAKGRFSEHTTCTITAPPSDVDLDGYYTKYLNCNGVAIVSGSNVPDEALYEVDKLYSFLLEGLDNVKAELISAGCYHALSDKGGVAFNDLPEVSGLGEGAGGHYYGGPRLAVTNVDNLFCRESNLHVGSNITVHEISHLIHRSGLESLYKGFNSELESAFSNAKQQGLWANTYSLTNKEEYLAEGVTVWYGVKVPGAEGGDGTSNEIYSRKLLQSYDPMLYSLISKHFNNATDIPGCVRPVTDVNVACVPTVTDIDGNVYNVVSIGAQCWMAENLRTTRFNDGTPIYNMTDHNGWNNDWFDQTIPSWINYDHDGANDAIYGKLYNHFAAKNPKLCPQGWHMPTQEEVALLLKQTSSQYNSDALRALTSWDIASGATNASGFGALAGGGVLGYDFDKKGEKSFFWTSSNGAAPYEFLGIGVALAPGKATEIVGNVESDGFSCRCVIDE